MKSPRPVSQEQQHRTATKQANPSPTKQTVIRASSGTHQQGRTLPLVKLPEAIYRTMHNADSAVKQYQITPFGSEEGNVMSVVDVQNGWSVLLDQPIEIDPDGPHRNMNGCGYVLQLLHR
jgi:hypothetical protein